MRLLTIDEARKMLGVTKRTLQRWDKNERLIAIRTQGGHRRYREADVKAMMGIDFKPEQPSENTIVESFRTTSEREFIEDVMSLFVRFLKKTNNKQ